MVAPGLAALFFAACAGRATPEQEVLVATIPPPAATIATYTPSPVGASTRGATAGAHALTPPSTTPSGTVTETPLPSATFTPTVTATSTRSPDAPTLTETTVVINTYDWKSHLLDTQPGDRLYPYPRLDYDPYSFDPGSAAPQTYRALVLENRYVSLTLLPELGGRIYRWLDKTTHRQLLYNNPVVKATGYGYRGWWLSVGGIEWGLPVDDHGFVEWVPWNYATTLTQETAAVIVSIDEERTGLQAAIRVELDSRHNYFSLTPVLHNPTTAPLIFQFWITAVAAPAGDNRAGPDLRFNLPLSSVLVHSTEDGSLPAPGQSISWPEYNGRDLSLYGNWQNYLSLFGTPTQAFSGLYAARADGGFVRVSNPQAARGLKLFGPASLPSHLWTNDDSSYVEFWGGITSNFSETATLQPDESYSWTEYWYPFHGIGNTVWANKEVALSVDDGSEQITVRLYTTSAFTGSVTLFVNNAPAARWDAVTAAPFPWQSTWARTLAGPIGITVSDSAGILIARYGQTP